MLKSRKARKSQDRSIVLPIAYIVIGEDGEDYGAHSFVEARTLVTYMARNGEGATMHAVRGTK